MGTITEKIMETYENYKGYGITYFTNTGTTYVNGYTGHPIKIFRELGEYTGREKAKKFIDDLVE